MKGILHFLVIAGTMLVLSQHLDGFHVSSFGVAVLAAVVLAFVNAVVKPVLALLTFPLTILTLGGFLFVLNVAMLWLTQKLVPGFDVHGLKALVLGSLLLSVVSTVWNAIIPDGRASRQSHDHDSH